ncbi:hypothetical protein, partial [Rahnella victoriana]|uniref:hypothetical protein n=1 Tax=Rahnella victoriana TaxID=1510570 RepID=UPI001A95521F
HQRVDKHYSWKLLNTAVDSFLKIEYLLSVNRRFSNWLVLISFLNKYAFIESSGINDIDL